MHLYETFNPQLVSLGFIMLTGYSVTGHKRLNSSNRRETILWSMKTDRMINEQDAKYKTLLVRSESQFKFSFINYIAWASAKDGL